MNFDKNKFVSITRNIVKYSSILSQTSLMIALTYIAIIELIPILDIAEDVYQPDFWVAIVLWIALLFVIIFWTNLNYLNWFGQLLTAIGQAASFFIVNGSILKNTETFPVFPVLNIFGWVLIGFMGLGLIFNILNLLIIMPILRNFEFNTAKDWIDELKTNIKSEKKKIIAGIIMTCILTTSAIVITSPNAWNSTTITIKPQNYQADIAFWASINPDVYSSTVKDELNEHGVMIITYDTYFNLSNPTGRADYVNKVTTWNTSYPNVKIMPAIPAPYGGFVWDGETEGTIELAKQYIEVSVEENLTNIIGMSFDWEKPQEDKIEEQNIDDSASVERNDASRDMWFEFFNWRDDNYPDMILQNVNYIGASVDVFDGDADITTAGRYNIFDVPLWDEYAPMLYRGEMDGTQPYGDYPNYASQDTPKPHYWFYSQMKLHSEAVNRIYGNNDRLGVYLGITNLTCYGRDVIQYQNGVEAGYGYDALVRDALISKHFGAKIITVFILNSVPSSNDPEDYYVMGGVFDVWGDSFLDDFNESINGVDSTNEFEIWYEPSIDGDLFTSENFEYFIFDFLYDLSGILGIIVFSSIIGINIFIMWKKQKNPNKINDDKRKLIE